MALSDQVRQSLDAASDNLREALAFAARNEKPFLIKEIASMIHNIQTIVSADELLDNVDSMLREASEE